MPFFSGATGPVYYRRWPAASPHAAVIFLHGFGEHSGLYHRLAAELGAHGVELWALDEIGHGLTSGERGQFGSFADLTANARTLTDLAAEALPAGTPLILAGHSLGAVAATLTALDSAAPYAGLLVTGAPLSPLPWLLEAARDPQAELELDPSSLSADPFYLGELEHDPLAFTSATVVETLAAAFPPAWARLDRELPDLELPILAIHGELDAVAPLAGVRAWTDRLPALQLHVIDGGLHDILNDTQHRQVAAQIARFSRQRTGVPVQQVLA